jgi:hypothetical protein
LGAGVRRYISGFEGTQAVPDLLPVRSKFYDKNYSYVRFEVFEAATMKYAGFSVLTRATRCIFPEDDNLHSHRHENLKSYII